MKHGFVKGGFIKKGFIKGGFVKRGPTRSIRRGEEGVEASELGPAEDQATPTEGLESNSLHI